MHMQHLTKQFCHENQNIIFTRADKGNITVDKQLYIKKLESLSDVGIHGH